MRRTLVNHLIETDHKDRYFLTADVGYGVLEPLQEKMGIRFINVGIAEQSMVGIASGLALSGKEVWTYTMCSFYLRAVEQIRNDILIQDLPVNMVGVGVGMEYERMGLTHFAIEDIKVFSSFNNIEILTPKTKQELQGLLGSKAKRMPRYWRLSRFGDNSEFTDTPVIVMRGSKYDESCGDLNYLREKHEEVS